MNNLLLEKRAFPPRSSPNTPTARIRTPEVFYPHCCMWSLLDPLSPVSPNLPYCSSILLASGYRFFGLGADSVNVRSTGPSSHSCLTDFRHAERGRKSLYSRWRACAKARQAVHIRYKASEDCGVPVTKPMNATKPPSLFHTSMHDLDAS
eukprot:6194469-Pleurochrysis_carterae.AAC.2